VSELVVGEAVVLEMRLAKLASRSLALALDFAVQLFLLIIVTFIVFGVQVDDALSAALALVSFVAVIVGYPVSFETLTRGRSLGKMALGLRVVREDGGPIRFRHALVRGLSGVVEFWLSGGAVALITSLASSKGKRVGDFLAGTVVVRERMPAQAAPVAMMPPQLAGWASTLDLARVPDDLALAARQFLGRFHDLAPEVRESMGSRLATAMAGVTTPPPPPGVPAWAFLSAVLAERRRREMARMLPPPGYHPMSPYGGHHPVAPQQRPFPPYGWQPQVTPPPPPPPPYGWQQPVAPQPLAPQPTAARPAEEAPPPRDGDPFTPPG
jgi:uncharacterized RDD family membrane protein YckC